MSYGTEGILEEYEIGATLFGATIATLVLTIEDVFLTVEPTRRGAPEIGVGNVIGSVVFGVTAKLGIILLAGGSIARRRRRAVLASPGAGRHDGARRRTSSTPAGCGAGTGSCCWRCTSPTGSSASPCSAKPRSRRTDRSRISPWSWSDAPGRAVARSGTGRRARLRGGPDRGTVRPAYRSSSATAMMSSNGPMTGRNSGIRSIGRQHPQHGDQERDLRAARHPRIPAEHPHGGHAVGQEPGEVLGHPGRQSPGQHDQHQPGYDHHSNGDQDRLQPTRHRHSTSVPPKSATRYQSVAKPWRAAGSPGSAVTPPARPLPAPQGGRLAT